MQWKFLISTLLKRQGFFLLGSIILVLTWYVQNFMIEKVKDQELFLRTSVEKFQFQTGELHDLYFKLNVAGVLAKQQDSGDAVAWLKQQLVLMDKNPCKIQRYFHDIQYGEDSSDASGQIEDRCDSAVDAIYNNKDWVYLMISKADTNALKFSDTAMKIAENRIVKLEKDSDSIHFWSIFLFVIGTVFISLNKALEYLRTLPPKTYKFE